MKTELHRSNWTERRGRPAFLSVPICGHLWLILILIFCTAVFAQSPGREYRRAHERQIIEEFTRLLAIPNIASDRTNLRRNADFIREMMQARGLSPQLLEGKSAD